MGNPFSVAKQTDIIVELKKLLVELEQKLETGGDVGIDNFPTDYPDSDVLAELQDKATSAKQLPDNHQVTVSNPTTNPETGLAKENKQLANDHDVNVSNQISGFSTSVKQDSILARTHLRYEYMGKDVIADTDYEYFGFKENGGANWKIMRKELANDTAWKYCYGTSGFATAWADPQNESYSNPPNS